MNEVPKTSCMKPNKLKMLRHKQRITLPVLAKRAKLSKGLISKLENSTHPNPTWHTMNKLSLGLNVPMLSIIAALL